MRLAIYNAVRATPAKVGVAGGSLVSVATVAWPEKVKAWANWAVTPEEIRILGLIACVVFLAYWLVLALLKPREKPDGGVSQSTSGAGSNNYSAARDVIINHPPEAATQPRKSPYGMPKSPWDDPKFSLLNPTPDYPLADRPQEYPLGAQGPKPDMELREVVERVSNSLGGPAELISDFEGRVERKIKDGVRHWRLHTWGRKNDPNAALEFVWGDAWAKGRLNTEKGWIRFKHPDNPNHVHSWTDLHFNREEVDRWLPPPKEGYSWLNV